MYFMFLQANVLQIKDTNVVYPDVCVKSLTSVTLGCRFVFVKLTFYSSRITWS